MKKLLIVLMILTMTSVASAAVVIDIWVNGGAYTGQDVKPSDYITVVVGTTVPLSEGWAETLMNISNGDLYDGSFGYDSAGDSWLVFGYQWQTPGAEMTGFDLYVNGTPWTPNTPDGDLYWFEFHVPDYKEESMWIYIDPIDGTWDGTDASVGAGDELPYIALHIVPEPMTVALLGLGGLFLIRRRNK